MLGDRQAMDLIQQAIARCTKGVITRGEAMDDLVATLEACGRDVSPDAGEVRVAAESRSWASPGGELAETTAAADRDPPVQDQPPLPF